MKRWLIIASVVAILTTIVVTRLWNGPVLNRAKLATIRVEAHMLTRTYPASLSGNWVDVPPNDWPPTIADLHPERVQVTGWGVDITIKSYFDGGWGYHILRDGRALPMPRECYSEAAIGVFWHGPC